MSSYELVPVPDKQPVPDKPGTDDMPYRCGLCERTFKTKQGVGLHRTRVHGITTSRRKRAPATPRAANLRAATRKVLADAERANEEREKRNRERLEEATGELVLAVSAVLAVPTQNRAALERSVRTLDALVALIDTMR